jgi:hypothetical protein
MARHLWQRIPSPTMYRSSLGPPRMCRLLLALGAAAYGSSSGAGQPDVDAGAVADGSLDVAAMDAPSRPTLTRRRAPTPPPTMPLATRGSTRAATHRSCLDASTFSALFTIANSAFSCGARTPWSRAHLGRRGTPHPRPLPPSE